MRGKSHNKKSPSKSRAAGQRVVKSLLPPCRGPKLSCFSESTHLDIEFLRLLSNPNTSQHSYVFEVKIGKSVYALKMFRFYRLQQDIMAMNDLQRSLIPKGELLYHYDPFYAECRAYGRMQERRFGRKRVAVPAFGYLMLSSSLQKTLEEKFQVYNWGRSKDEEKLPISRRTPFRAIVKQLVLESNKWDVKTLQKMLQDLFELRRMGIYNVDISADNYAGNRLADFSLALTEPSLILDTKSKREAEGIKLDDLRGFDEMLEDEDAVVDSGSVCAWDSYEYRTRLRSHGLIIDNDDDDD